MLHDIYDVKNDLYGWL